MFRADATKLSTGAARPTWRRRIMWTSRMRRKGTKPEVLDLAEPTNDAPANLFRSQARHVTGSSNRLEGYRRSVPNFASSGFEMRNYSVRCISGPQFPIIRDPCGYRSRDKGSHLDRVIDVQGRRDEIIHRRGASHVEATDNVHFSNGTKRYRDVARQTGCTKLKLADNCFSSARVTE